MNFHMSDAVSTKYIKKYISICIYIYMYFHMSYAVPAKYINKYISIRIYMYLHMPYAVSTKFD